MLMLMGDDNDDDYEDVKLTLLMCRHLEEVSSAFEKGRQQLIERILA